ncbi:MAG TPA: hypothetical protein VGM27_01425 [Acidobacteriaceae bacterium]
MPVINNTFSPHLSDPSVEDTYRQESSSKTSSNEIQQQAGLDPRTLPAGNAAQLRRNGQESLTQPSSGYGTIEEAGMTFELLTPPNYDDVAAILDAYHPQPDSSDGAGASRNHEPSVNNGHSEAGGQNVPLDAHEIPQYGARLEPSQSQGNHKLGLPPNPRPNGTRPKARTRESPAIQKLGLPPNPRLNGTPPKARTQESPAIQKLGLPPNPRPNGTPPKARAQETSPGLADGPVTTKVVPEKPASDHPNLPLDEKFEAAKNHSDWLTGTADARRNLRNKGFRNRTGNRTDGVDSNQ